MENLVNIPDVVKKLNELRLSHKDKWAMGSIILKDVSNHTPATIKINYKMYNTWVQALIVELTVDNKVVFRVKDGSSMDLKPTEFKKWIADTLNNMLNEASIAMCAG